MQVHSQILFHSDHNQMISQVEKYKLLNDNKTSNKNLHKNGKHSKMQT